MTIPQSATKMVRCRDSSLFMTRRGTLACPPHQSVKWHNDLILKNSCAYVSTVRGRLQTIQIRMVTLSTALALPTNFFGIVVTKRKMLQVLGPESQPMMTLDPKMITKRNQLQASVFLCCLTPMFALAQDRPQTIIGSSAPFGA